MSRDLGNNIRTVQTIAPSDKTATTTGTAVDRAGYNSVAVIVEVGAITAGDATNYFTFTVDTSPDNATWTALDSSKYYNPTSVDAGTASTWDYLLNSTTADDASVKYFGVDVGDARYVRVVATETLTAQALFGASFILGEPTHSPT